MAIHQLANQNHALLGDGISSLDFYLLVSQTEYL